MRGVMMKTKLPHCFVAFAFAALAGTALGASSPYAGEEHRPIKALSSEGAVFAFLLPALAR